MLSILKKKIAKKAKLFNRFPYIVTFLRIVISPAHTLGLYRLI